MFDRLSQITLSVAKKGGGGGGGTSNYNDLDHKPKINNVELSGNKSLSDIGVPVTSMKVENEALIFNY